MRKVKNIYPHFYFSRPLQSCYSLSHFYIFEVIRASEFCAGKVGGAAGSNVNKGRIDHDVELVKWKNKVVTVLPAPLKWGPIGNLGPWRRSALKGNKHWSAACIGPAHWDRRDFITEWRQINWIDLKWFYNNFKIRAPADTCNIYISIALQRVTSHPLSLRRHLNNKQQQQPQKTQQIWTSRPALSPQPSYCTGELYIRQQVL